MKIEYDDDPAIRYEYIACAAFKCRYYDDPFQYASQTVFNINFEKDDNGNDGIKFKGKRALSTVLIKLIIDSSSQEQRDAYRGLEDKVWNAKSQEDIIIIIDEAIEIYNQSIA